MPIAGASPCRADFRVGTFVDDPNLIGLRRHPHCAICLRSHRPMHAFYDWSDKRYVVRVNVCGFQCGGAAEPASRANDGPGTSSGSRRHVGENHARPAAARRGQAEASDVLVSKCRRNLCCCQRESEWDHPATAETRRVPTSLHFKFQEIQGAGAARLATSDASSWIEQFASRFPGRP